MGFNGLGLFRHLFSGVQTDSDTVKALLATDLSYLEFFYNM